MPLSLRKRGSIWHARGTIRVGKEAIGIAEFSTGASGRADAEAIAAAEEARQRADHLEGAAGRSRRLTLADCFAAYLMRPGGVQPYDVKRVADFNAEIGSRPISDAASAWSEWLRRRSGWAPATAARSRTILLAALTAGCKAHGIAAPEIPPVRQRDEERVIYLSEAEREALLAAYNPHAYRPVLVLAYQGLRTQEALRMDWRHVHFERQGSIHIPAERTKTGRGRTVPMHVRVRNMLEGLWATAGQPDRGPVFLSQRGRPYSDTRGQGGNPLSKAHASACAKAGIVGFRVHDWRHDWAARMVMSGADLEAVRRLGGWSSLRMVQRYASVSADHLRAAIDRI